MPHSGGKLEWITRKYFQCPAQLPSKADSGCYYSISLRENLTFLWMWELDYKESSALKNWCFWTVVLEKTLESPLDCKEIQKSILKEISPEYSWKDWCWSWSSNTMATWCKELIHLKRCWCWERLKVGGEGDNRRWDVGWHHRLNGHEFEQTLGGGEGQGRLVCCSPRSHKESGTTEQLNNNKWPCHSFKDCALPLPSCFIRSFLTSLGLSIGLRQVPRPLDWKHAPSSRHTIPAAQIC